MYCFKLPKLKKIQIINEKNGITADQIKRKYNPDWFCNLALYDDKTKTNITLLEAGNTTSGYLFTPDGIGVKNSKEPLWCTFQEAKASKEIDQYVSGSPVLMRAGKNVKDFGNKYSSYVDGKHMRTMVGLTDKNEVVLCAINYNIGLELARDRVKAKVPNLAYLLNCDGGGSVHLQNRARKYVSSGRKNASWLLLWEEDVIKEPAPVIKNENEKEDDEVVVKKQIKIDGIIKECNVIIKEGKTYVQLRDFESLGYQIGYANNIASIDKPNK